MVVNIIIFFYLWLVHTDLVNYSEVKLFNSGLSEAQKHQISVI